MKNIKFYFVLLFALGCYSALAQNAYVQPQPSDANYILARTYQEEKNSSSEISLDTDVVETIQYFDGLGRSQQTIAIGQSPLGADMVTPVKYDDYGRVVEEWLSYPAPDDGTRGNYQAGSAFGVQQFYQTLFPDDFTGMPTLDVNSYSEKKLEPSPLNRVLKQAAPGKDWAIADTGDDHSVEFAYESNMDNEVKMFAVTTVSNGDTYEPTLVFLKDDQNADIEFYVSGELQKNIMYDENHVSGKNRSTEEFKDKSGRLVLKRTYADVGAQTEVAHDTYYVYDDHGNLTFVFPPKMNAGSGTTTLTNIGANLDELGYQYVYDHRNRLVEKKIPGKDWEYIVYNTLDQPIMTQDALQRASNEWLFTQYDVFGRVAYTGKANITGSRPTVQATVSGLLQSHVLWTSRTPDANTTNTIGGKAIHYNTNGYPQVADITEVLTVNYYDNYDFDRANEPTPPGTVYDENLDNSTKGLATGSLVKVLDTNNWITTVTRYDEKGLPIYAYSENEYLGTVDMVETDMDFTGKPITLRSAHTRNGNTIVTIDNFTYDHVGRVLKQTQCIGDQTLGYSCAETNVDAVLELLDTSVITSQTATSRIEVKATNNPVTLSGTLTLSINPSAGGSGASEELIAYNQYDELGQLAQKKVGGAPGVDYAGTQALQTVDYTYNVRGWVKQLNDPTTLGADLFAFGVNYNTATHNGTPLFNGNIAETEWKTANDNTLRWYRYGYDPLSRILTATGGPTSNYDVSNIAYDKNGNMTSLLRNGVGGPMDNLSYAYHNSEMSNRLQAVADASGNVEGFKDGVTAATEYTYDANGNLLTDGNKDINNMTYNHLNLPTFIDMDAGNISYIYDAAGAKLRKTAGSSVTDYAGNYVYSGNGGSPNLEFMSHAEGYVTPSAVEGSYDYIYQFKDHLGNVRLSYVNKGTPTVHDLEIVEESNYYPFGLRHKGYNEGTSPLGNNMAQKWKYGGKELDDSYNGTLATYDFGARNYNPDLGRWMNIDPWAEKYIDVSPYNYAANNPVYFVDPDGRGIIGNPYALYGAQDPYGDAQDPHRYEGGIRWSEESPPWIDNGDGTFTAEAGDSAVTLAEDANISMEKANKIVESQLGPNYIGKDGKLKSNVEVGDVVSIPDDQKTDIPSKSISQGFNSYLQFIDMDLDGRIESFVSGDSVITPQYFSNYKVPQQGSTWAIDEAANSLLETIFGSSASHMISTETTNSYETYRLDRRDNNLPLIGPPRDIDSLKLLKIANEILNQQPKQNN